MSQPLSLQHVNVKLFAEDPRGVDQAKFTLIFQRWIQEKACEELLLDVADYLHVPAGPGIVLIGHEADYSMDDTGHRLGLRYNRKTEVAGDNPARFGQALGAALKAAQRLEKEALLEGRLRFNRRELDLSVNDRALAPNTPQTWETARPELEGFVKKAFAGNSFELLPETDPRRRFGVKIQLAQPFEFDAVLKNL